MMHLVQTTNMIFDTYLGENMLGTDDKNTTIEVDGKDITLLPGGKCRKYIAGSTHIELHQMTTTL